jgi:hypothetical protein
MTRILTFCIGLLATVPALLAQTGHAHGGMESSKSERTVFPELGASAVFDTKGRLWAAHKHEGHVVVSRSVDTGKSWSQPVRLNATPEATDPGGDARPKIALGPDGEVFVTWTRALAKPYTGEIRFARSLDDGRTWSTPIVVHRHREEITHRFDAITVDRHGRIFAAWIDKRDAIAAAAAKTAYRGAAVYFAVSDDLGASFRGDFKAADHSCECCRIALVTSAQGQVVAMWRHVFEPNIRDHAVAVLQADGRTMDFRRATFDDWRLDACPHHGPSLVTGADEVRHAVWFTGAPHVGVFYGQLSAAGVTARRQVGGKAAAHADLAVMGRQVAIAWKEFVGEQMRLRALRSDDGGSTWSEHELSGTRGPSDQPRVLVRQGRFHVFWNTRDEPLSVTPLP